MARRALIQVEGNPWSLGLLYVQAAQRPAFHAITSLLIQRIMTCLVGKH